MATEQTISLVSATPVLPSLDIERTVAFYRDKLAFKEIHAAAGGYAIVERGPVELHFWFTEDAALPKASGCRIHVTGIDDLYAQCQNAGIVHPHGRLTTKPWGTREFAILDSEGNCLTFWQDGP
jgi:catechol 2,3-dioxygenase-like lactoylglutathione lyase family enzyme